MVIYVSDVTTRQKSGLAEKLWFTVENNEFKVTTNFGSEIKADFNVVPLNDTTTHVVITFDGDSIYTYYNNVKQTKISAVGSGWGWDAGSKLIIGADEYGGDAFANDAIIRLVRIYNRALTTDEIEDNYNSASVQGKLP